MNTLSYKTISINRETAKKEWVVVDATDQVVGRLCSFTPSSDGKQLAFIMRGDVYVTSVEHGTTKRITQSAGADALLPDVERIAFTTLADEEDGLVIRSEDG